MINYIFVGDTKEEAKIKAEKLGVNISFAELEPAKWLSPNTLQKIARETEEIDENGNKYYELLLVWFSDIWSEEDEENS